MKSNAIPKHVAIIMDGNGRWAEKRSLPRSVGHIAGVKNIDIITDYLFNLGVNTLTLFAFSTENWNRPINEVDGLLLLFKNYLIEKVPDLIKKNIGFNVFGDISFFDEETQTLIQQYSLVNSDKCLNICFNYGGRSEIIRAINSFVDKSCVSEAELRSALYTKNLPDPDVLIRTGGEHRISNFLLFQIAYSEIYFIDTLWPDFSTDELQNILNDYAITDRRFGKI